MTRRRRTAWAAALLVAAVVAVYGGALDGPFQFDDWHVIPENPAVRSPADIPSFFTDLSTFSVLPGNRDYRPVFLTSMALCWWLGGGSTWPFHLLGTLLHAANALLLFALFRRLFRRASDPVGGLPDPEAERAALLAAALFALHPLASEAALYISSQSILLADFFALTSLLLFLGVNASERPLTRGGARTRRLGSYVAYALALLSKPIAFTLPAILLLWEALFGGAAQTAGPGGAGPRWVRRLRKHAPYLLISVAYLLVREAVFSGPFGGGGAPRSRLAHTLTETHALVFYYLRLALLPVGLNVDREWPVSVSPFAPGVLLALGVGVGIGAALLRWRRNRNLVFWTLWFPAWLFVTTYGVVLRQVVREGRAYLALAGVCALAGLFFFRLWNALPREVPGARVGRGAAATAALLVLAALALGSVQRAELWRSELALWGDAAQGQGTWRAHMNHGLALEAANRREEALSEFERAVALAPNAWSHTNLGLAYVKRGRLEEGMQHLRRAAALWPDAPEPHYYLAYGLERVGQLDEAERELERALELRPHYERAQRELARLRERLGTGADAADADELFRRARALHERGERASAIELYERALRLAPLHRDAAVGLAIALADGASAEDRDYAARLLEAVLELDPGDAEARRRLAALHRELGDADRAANLERAR